MTIRLRILLAAGWLAACLPVVCTLASLGASSVRAGEPLVPNAKVNVGQAIKAAEAKGGAAESASFTAEKGGRWEVAMAPGAGAKPVTYLVDPNTGKVTGEVGRPALASAKSAIPAAVVAPAEAATAKPPLGLAGAVALAEKRYNGAAIEAHVEREGGRPVNVVSLSTLDGRRDVRVDGEGRLTVE